MFAFADQKKADSNGKSNGNGTQCQLIRWKSIAVSEVQTSQFGGLAVFNLQERTNRLFLATIQHGQGIWLWVYGLDNDKCDGVILSMCSTDARHCVCSCRLSSHTSCCSCVDRAHVRSETALRHPYEGLQNERVSFK